MRKRHHTLHWSFVLLACALGPLACGGGTTDQGGAGGGLTGSGSAPSTGTGNAPGVGNSPGSSTDISVDLSGDSGGPGPGGPSEGGVVALTPEQLAAIDSGSCAGWTAEGENLPAILQLVVDVSLSMNTQAPGGGTRWAATRDALSQAIENLPASMSVGVLFYPNVATLEQGTSRTTPIPVEQCIGVDEIVPIAQLGEAASAQRTALEDAIADATVNGYTPTHDAYKYALENSLIPYTGAAGSSKFMLLITDGAPTQAADGCVFAPAPVQCPIGCGPNPPATPCPDGCVQGGPGGGGQIRDVATQPIIDEIAGAFSQGIRTFLIGSPGSEVGSDNQDKRPWLSQAAQSGGTATDGCTVAGPNFCHLDMTQEENFSVALTEGLAAVVGQVVDTCSFSIPDPPPGETIDADTTSLIVVWGDGTASAFLQDNVDECDAGWHFTDATQKQIDLCPSSCDLLKQGQGATVRLSFGCTDVIK